jgi:hypothetical protein
MCSSNVPSNLIADALILNVDIDGRSQHTEVVSADSNMLKAVSCCLQLELLGYRERDGRPHPSVRRIYLA